MASVPLGEQLANTPDPPLPKGKGTKHLFRSPDRDVEESRVGRNPNLGEKKDSRSGSMKRKGWTPQ